MVSASAPTQVANIAHRGACAYAPEHSARAKRLAHAQGAHYLEQDLVLSADGVPMVMHDLVLDAVTNVAEVFPGRCREDGCHYTLDFTVAELKELELGPRRELASQALRYPERDLGRTERLVTLDEELVLVRELSREREVGIYPELKHPEWHRQQGVELGRAVIDVLGDHGYRGGDESCLLQCFDATELARVHAAGHRYPLVQLISSAARPDHPLLPEARWAGMSFAAMFNAQGEPTSLLHRVHEVGMAIHAYTLKWDDLPPFADDAESLVASALAQGCEGFFTDFPDRLHALLGSLGASS